MQIIQVRDHRSYPAKAIVAEPVKVGIDRNLSARQSLTSMLEKQSVSKPMLQRTALRKTEAQGWRHVLLPVGGVK